MLNNSVSICGSHDDVFFAINNISPPLQKYDSFVYLQKKTLPTGCVGTVPFIFLPVSFLKIRELR